MMFSSTVTRFGRPTFSKHLLYVYHSFHELLFEMLYFEASGVYQIVLYPDNPKSVSNSRNVVELLVNIIYFDQCLII